MTGTDLAVILVCLAAVASFVVLLVAALALLRTLRELREALRALHDDTLPLVRALRATVAEAGAEVERVDALLDAADSIAATVDSATRLSYLAFRAPLIRVVAFFRGMGRALRRLVGLDRARRSSRARRRRDELAERRRVA
ncbi:MAG: hypothetical protein N2037_04955 [Acidimicrobiales bacterium]|nr:hypothetical protein [Acidimicrobiales bacterium]